MTVTPLSENELIKEIQQLAKRSRRTYGTDAIEYTPTCFVRHLGNGVFEIIIGDDEPYEIIDGRSDRDRRIDREIEAWAQARQAWVEFGFSVDPKTGVVKRRDKD